MQCNNILYIFFPRLSRQIFEFFVKLTHKYALVNEILTRQAFFALYAFCIVRSSVSPKIRKIKKAWRKFQFSPRPHIKLKHHFFSASFQLSSSSEIEPSLLAMLTKALNAS